MDKDQKHIPFAVIVAATNGDETAIQEILDFYDGYISKLSLRKLYEELGGSCSLPALRRYSSCRCAVLPGLRQGDLEVG